MKSNKDWWRLCGAADQGDADAQFNLGSIYDNGEGIRKNKAKAAAWYRLAAAQGDARALYRLGIIYFECGPVSYEYQHQLPSYRLNEKWDDVIDRFDALYSKYEHLDTDGHLFAYVHFSLAASLADESLIHDAKSDRDNTFKKLTITEQEEGKNMVDEYLEEIQKREIHKRMNIKILREPWEFAKYGNTGDFPEDLAPVGLDRKWGFINKYGEEVVPLKYDEVGLFHEGLAQVRLFNKKGYVNREGKEVVPVKYERTKFFIQGLAKVELNGKKGYVNTEGKEVVPLKYDAIGDFSEAIARFKLNNKFGFVDTTGKEVVPAKYDWMEDFKDGISKMRLGYRFGYTDTQGQEYWDITRDETLQKMKESLDLGY